MSTHNRPTLLNPERALPLEYAKQDYLVRQFWPLESLKIARTVLMTKSNFIDLQSKLVTNLGFFKVEMGMDA
ncbi:unnamed protein product [Prunus armeniaca]